MCKISSRLDEKYCTYSASRFEKDSRKKTIITTILKKKLPNKFCIYFKTCTIKAFGQISFQENFLLRKISKEAPNFQLTTVVLSLKLPVRGLVITIQYCNIVTLVTRSLDESLGQSLGKIVGKSMGSDPMRDSFLALRDSCRDSG